LNKIDRLAVLLSGDFRHWPRAAEYIFEFAENKANRVDYYFATWTTTRDYWYPQPTSILTKRSVTDSDITDKFTNRNLIAYKLVEQLPEYPTSNYYQSYLGNIASILKRRHELDNNFVYDQVIEIRPDLYIRDESTPIKLTDFECLVDIQYAGKVQNIHFPQATDFYYQANSFGSDVMANRFYYQKSIEAAKIQKFAHWPMIMHNHWILVDFIYARRMQNIYQQHPITQIAIRPNFPQDDLRNYTYQELFDIEAEFLNINRKGQQEH
jgi:hypothetical protein